MSLALNGMRGGQPSTTQPIAAPWLSPKVVTRNKWPNVFNDMKFGAEHRCCGLYDANPLFLPSVQGEEPWRPLQPGA